MNRQLGNKGERTTLKHGTLLATIAIAGVLLALAAVSAGADVLANNLDPANASSYKVYGPSANGLNGQQAGAAAFTVSTSSDFALNSITAIVKYMSGSARTFELALYSTDSSSNLPYSQIASRTLTIDTASDFTAYTADFGNAIRLTAGTTYWAAIQAPTPGSDMYLSLKKGTTLSDNARAMYGNMGAKLPDGTAVPPYWMHMWTPGFEIQGTPLPEPSALLALSVGTSILAFTRRRRYLAGK
jgi:uncharacterized membrane protein